MANTLERARYAARQTARVAWYAGAYLMARRMQGPVRGADGAPIRPSVPTPGWQPLLADIAALFAEDLADAERGLHPVPNDWTQPMLTEIATMRRFMADVPEVARRREERSADEPFLEHRGKRPRYYLQNFHFQSGGWMTEDSAALYDHQVEVLFSGAAAAMRRRALSPIAEQLRGRDQRIARLLDVATGTGRWMKDLRPAFPGLPVTLLDMSEAYLGAARRTLPRDGRRRELVGAAEAIPLATGSQDIVTAIYLFHELPPKIRRQAATEIARVTAPGGLFVLVDSIQRGEHPPYDGLLELFPAAFHEPYYASYLDEDLVGLFADAGLTLQSRKRAFLSTVAAFKKAN
jgi:ubiquinone/menaquinone biosynthesis C-methylase UbiE